MALGGMRRPTPGPTPDLAVTPRSSPGPPLVEPRLAGARVREVLVGLRPGRPAVRVEVERTAGMRVVHCYGHGGNGVMLSWGSAATAVALLDTPAVASDRGSAASVPSPVAAVTDPGRGAGKDSEQPIAEALRAKAGGTPGIGRLKGSSPYVPERGPSAAQRASLTTVQLVLAAIIAGLVVGILAAVLTLL